MGGETTDSRIAALRRGRFTGTMIDFVINNWMLIAVAAASGGMLLWPVVQGGGGGLLAQ
jgi:hypothetical protein